MKPINNETITTLTNLNIDFYNVIEVLNNIRDTKQENIYRDTIWEITKRIRDIVGSPNSRKN